MGFRGNPGHPDVQAAIEHAIARIRSAGKAAGILSADQSLGPALHRTGRGVRRSGRRRRRTDARIAKPRCCLQRCSRRPQALPVLSTFDAAVFTFLLWLCRQRRWPTQARILGNPADAGLAL